MDKCPICDASACRYLPYKGGSHGTLRFSAIALCEACSAGFAIPRPDQPTLDRFYESGAYWHASSAPLQRAHEASQAWIRVECIRKLAGKNSLAVADIGAGHGGIAQALAGHGVGVARYAFVEPDAHATAEISALRLPFRVEHARSVSELRGPFDLVFLNHVLEHVAEPLELLRQVNGLAPGGVVYVETPHADYRFKDDVFPHLFFFTPKAFGVLGERLGVRTIACEAFGKLPAPRLSAVGLTQRLASRALHRVGSAPLQRVLDRIVWRYAPCDEGIWLRWIFSGMNAR